MTCREWLRANSYEDVAALIDRAMSSMALRGSRQRRNWWEILAGRPNGSSHVREGIEFPVLQVAQKRQGKPVTPGALRRNDCEDAPGLNTTGRWTATKATKGSRLRKGRQTPSRPADRRKK